MIKATMTCTRCKLEKELSATELMEAVSLDAAGELNLCSDCRVLWEKEVQKLRAKRAKDFEALQKQFGIGK